MSFLIYLLVTENLENLCLLIQDIVREFDRCFKGVCAVFRSGCDAVFYWNGVSYKNSDQLWLFHCTNIRRVFGSTLNPRPRAQTTFSSLCKKQYSIKPMVDPFNMYLKYYLKKKMHHCLHIATFAILFY